MNQVPSYIFQSLKARIGENPTECFSYVSSSYAMFLHIFTEVWKHESMRILHNVLFCAMLTLRTRENVTNLPLICCYLVCGYCLLILLQKERFWMQKSTESLSFASSPVKFHASKIKSSCDSQNSVIAIFSILSPCDKI